MILADKIINERKRNGWSQEELADKLSVSRQAVSKWESAQSVPDLQRIIKMADVFGVTTDYLLKDEIEAFVPEGLFAMEESQVTPLKRVSMEEANSYINVMTGNAKMFANAVSLCILSPVLLIILAGISEEKVLSLSESVASGLGMVALFGMIATAVYIFITRGAREKKFDYLKNDCFETEYGVSGMVKEKWRNYEPIHTKGIATGVVLCFVAVLPLIIAGCMEASDFVCILLTGLLLAVIAVGVNLIVRVSVMKACCDTLLQEGEFTAEEKAANKKLERFSGIYWCAVTAAYLAVSFLTMRWDRTWIIWPVAGVFFAAAKTMMRSVIEKRERQ